MAARTLEQRLAALRSLDPAVPKSIDEVRDALRSSIGLLVAAAAKQVAAHRLELLVPELATAFERLCVDPAKRDPGCRGKVAIARALHAIDYWEDRVFVAGLRYVQREGWPGPNGGAPDDTAAELRGVCGLAHAHFARRDALDVLADLLVDPETTTRVAAARALGDAGRPDATALLRFKIRVGDREPEVLSECVESLLSLARESSYDFVVALLAKHDDAAEAAALALGGARIADSFDDLLAWCKTCSAEQRRRVGYLALALLRADQANDYLLDEVRSRPKADALAAGRALATFKDDATIAKQIRDAAGVHKDTTVRRELLALLD